MCCQLSVTAHGLLVFFISPSLTQLSEIIFKILLYTYRKLFLNPALKFIQTANHVNFYYVLCILDAIKYSTKN